MFYRLQFSDIIEMILTFLVKKNNQLKEDNEAKIDVLISASFEDAYKLEYPSYKKLNVASGEVLLKNVKEILLEMGINEVTKILEKDNIDIFIKNVISRKIITVTTNSGSEQEDDLYNFYKSFKIHFMKSVKERINNNNKAYKKSSIESMIEQGENAKLVKSQLNNISEDIKDLKKDREVRETKDNEEVRRIIIYNIKTIPEELKKQCYSYLDLSRYFDGRLCKDVKGWENIKKDVDEFTKSFEYSITYQIELVFICYSIAYYLGLCLNSKTGRKIKVRQGNKGLEDWTPDLSNDEKEYVKFLVDDKCVIDKDTDDIAITISATQDIRNDVVEYIKGKDINVKKVIHFELPDEIIGNKSVQGGNNAWKLAQQIKNWLNSNRTIKEKQANIHIFMAAPVTMAFFLGQQSFTFNNVSLYEYI